MEAQGGQGLRSTVGSRDIPPVSRILCANRFEVWGAGYYDLSGGVGTGTSSSGCRLYARSYILDVQKNFLLLVSPYVQRQLDIQDLLSMADIGDHEIDNILSGLSLVGSNEGMTIEELKDRYSAITATTSWALGL
jgi:hypothetical protein